MNKYELVIVLKPTLDEDALNAEFGQIEEIVTRYGGAIEKTDHWGKRKLAYEIEKIREGVYRFMHFTAPANAPAEIESRMRIREDVMRYLIVKTDDTEKIL